MTGAFKPRNLVPALFLALFWFLQRYIKTDGMLYILSGISLSGLILIFSKKLKLQERPWKEIFVATFLVSILYNSWSIVNQINRKEDLIRGYLRANVWSDLQSPLYCHIRKEFFLEHFTFQIIATLLALFIIYRWREKILIDPKQRVAILISCILIVGFFFDQIPANTFLTDYHHYGIISRDLSKLDIQKTILEQWNEKQTQFGVHNNHYPPGFLSLAWLDKYTHFPVFKVSVLLMTLLAIPLIGILSQRFSKKTIGNFAILLFGSSAAIIYFPQPATDPFLIAPALMGFIFVDKGIRKASMINGVYFGLVISFMIFFNFIAIPFIAFCGLYSLLSIWNKKEDITRLVVFYGTAFIMVGVIYFLINLIWGFDLLECFLGSRINNSRQMNHRGLPYWQLHLIFSTGNLIAFFALIGPPIIGVIYPGKITLKENPKLLYLFATISSSLLIFAFSGLFFLEVERIWVIFTPFLLILAGKSLEILEAKEKNLGFLLLLMVLVFTLGFHLLIDHRF